MHDNSRGNGSRSNGRGRRERPSRDDEAPASSGDVVEVSFEDSFDAELADELGDLGPRQERPARSGSGGGNRRGGGRRRHR